MKKIFKYELTFNKSQKVRINLDFEILSVQNQNEKLVFWALVDEETRFLELPISIYTTGEAACPIHYEGSPSAYLGTVQFEKGAFVVHVFLG